MTGYGEIAGAVEAIKRGAQDYLPKPVQTEKVLAALTGLLQQQQEKMYVDEWGYYQGKSPLTVKLQEHIRLVAPVDTLTVLIRGASGTGKEYVARQIHALSERADTPFIAVDCGALPKELAASELFGHMKGTFTGAMEDKQGMFARRQPRDVVSGRSGITEHGGADAIAACIAGETFPARRRQNGSAGGHPTGGRH